MRLCTKKRRWGVRTNAWGFYCELAGWLAISAPVSKVTSISLAADTESSNDRLLVCQAIA